MKARSWIFAVFAVVVLLLGSMGQDAMATVYIDNGREVVYDGTTETISEYYILGNTTSGNTLRLLNNANIQSTSNVCLGYYQSADYNSMTVEGGSTWSHSGQLTVGSNGDHNALRISNGGQINTGGIGYVGLGVSANYNTVVVTGDDSAWNVGNGLYVGGFADGRQFGYYNEVTVNNGASLRASQIRTYSSNIFRVADATVQVVGGNALDLRGTEEFSGSNALVLEFADLAAMESRTLTLMTGLDAESLTETFDVIFRDGQGTLYKANKASFSYSNGTWGMMTGDDFSTVPEPASLALLSLGSIALFRRKQN